MKISNRNLCAGTLSVAVLASLFAYAAVPSGTAPTSLATTSASTAGAPALGAKVMLAGASAQPGINRFIVRYKDGSTARSSQTSLLGSVNAAAIRAGVAGMKFDSRGVGTVLSMQHVRRMSVGADVIRLSRSLNQTEVEALLTQLRADPTVEFAQPDYLRKRTDFIPDDPRYADLQWHYFDPTAGIHAPTAWDTSTGEGVVVAVLDTGYLDHADLAANIVPGYDFIYDPAVAGDGDGRDADAHDPGDWEGEGGSSFHGTHVAGTIAAVTNNGLQLAGVAFNAKVQPVRVLGHGGGYSSDIADAITWASGGTTVPDAPVNPTPADVINMSLGGWGFCADDPVTQTAIDGAVSRGVTVVVASGNDNSDASQFTPASCKGVITVGATGVDGARSYFSNYGPTVTLSAPGGNATSGLDPTNRFVWSLGNSGYQTPDPSPAGDRMVGMIGTSMASPHVAGIVALMQSAAVGAGRPALTPAQVKTLLRITVSPYVVPPPLMYAQGPGIANAAAAVEAATHDIPPDQGELLDNRVAATGLSGAAGDALLYKIFVPAGKTSVNLRTYGGTGNVSLYTAFERAPSPDDFDRKSVKPGNSETVLLTRPAAGTYYLLVVGETAFSGVAVTGVY